MAMPKLKSSFIATVMFYMLITASLIISGCSSGSDCPSVSSLNLYIDPIIQKSTASASASADSRRFMVELLTTAGKNLQTREVATTDANERLLVSFVAVESGSYMVRVTAFDKDDASLGSYVNEVQLLTGNNTITVSSLDNTELSYTELTELPHTKSPEGLANFLSYKQPGIDLQAYCFFGALIEEGKPVNSYFSLVQRLETNFLPGTNIFRFPHNTAGVGYSNKDLKKIVAGGSDGYNLLGVELVFTQPWTVTVSSPNPPLSPLEKNITSMKLLSGVMGQAGARYQITSSSTEGVSGTLETDVIVNDIMGFISEGYGPAAFYPQWLYQDQYDRVMKEFGGSVSDYLKSSGDGLGFQGSYYYSAPFLQVESFEIKRDDIVVSKGTDGLLWMDVVYQSFHQRDIELVLSAEWNFFTIQFPSVKKAIMIAEVKNAKTPRLISAALFSPSAPRNRNGVLSQDHNWKLDEIEYIPLRSWVSPNSGLIYDVDYRIILKGDRKADLTITTDWDEQEIIMGENTAKYEGLAKVKGTLDGEYLEGLVWLELVAAGHI